MPVKFRGDRDETVCGVAVGHGKLHGPFACWRISGHGGEHIALACDAATADGVCHACRNRIDERCEPDCYARRTWRQRFRKRVAMMAALLSRTKSDETPTPRAIGAD